ncbi:TPA: protein kinase [Candidatus Woesearchaeota archaeon]|nr:protein kinase [Candidatus Woesearchaeota archaeon]
MTLAQAQRRLATPLASPATPTLETITERSSALAINGTIIDGGETFRLEKGRVLAIGDEHYTVEAKLGEGGEGISYLAHDNNGVRKVMKIYREMNGGNLHEKLSRELLRVNKALGTTAELVRLNSVDHAVIRDYVEGLNLAEYLTASKRAFTGNDAVAFLLQMARTECKPVHDERLVHGDIKPQNIIVSEQDGKRTYKLIDFGCIHEEGPVGTKTLIAPQGTLGYSRLLNTKHDPTDDLYALAETTYFLINGKEPTAQFDPTMDKLDDNGKIERLNVSAEFKKVLMKMYGHDEKYASTDELIKDLEGLTENETVPIDLASAKRIETVRSKEKPSEALMQEIKGIEAIFQTEYAGVKFARDKPLDNELLTRLDNVLGKLHYTRAPTDTSDTVYVRKRLHEGKNEAFIIHNGKTAYFTHVITEKEGEFTRPDTFKDIPKKEDAYYVGKQVGRLVVPALGAGVALGVGALTIGPTMVIGATAALGAGIAAGLNLIGTFVFVADYNPKCLDSRDTLGFGFLPGGQHHLIGKASEYITRRIEWNRHGEHRKQGNVLEDALTAIPLYEYD